MNDLDVTFSALADATRRGILTRLARGESTVGELARPYNISLPAISRHLRVLQSAALIVCERRGKHRVCRLEARHLSSANQWLELYRKFWNESFDRLDEHLKRNKAVLHASAKKR